MALFAIKKHLFLKTFILTLLPISKEKKNETKKAGSSESDPGAINSSNYSVNGEQIMS